MPSTRTLLLAIAVLLVVLIALVAVLLLRQPQQPAKQSPTTEQRTRTPEKLRLTKVLSLKQRLKPTKALHKLTSQAVARTL